MDDAVYGVFPHNVIERVNGETIKEHGVPAFEIEEHSRLCKQYQE